MLGYEQDDINKKNDEIKEETERRIAAEEAEYLAKQAKRKKEADAKEKKRLAEEKLKAEKEAQEKEAARLAAEKAAKIIQDAKDLQELKDKIEALKKQAKEHATNAATLQQAYVELQGKVGVSQKELAAAKKKADKAAAEAASDAQKHSDAIAELKNQHAKQIKELKDADAIERQNLIEAAEKLAGLRAEQVAAATAAEAAEDAAEQAKATADSGRISDLEAIIKKNANDLEYANNHKRHLKEVAEEQKRIAENAKK